MTDSYYNKYLQSLPADWLKVPIERLGSIFSGGTPSRNELSFWKGTIAWVTPGEITELKDKYLTKTREYITEIGLANCNTTLLPSGTLLVTTRATIGKVAIAYIDVSTNQGFKSIILDKSFNSLFYYYLLSWITADEMRRLASGSTFDEISQKDFIRIIVPQPFLLEQRRIAGILDTLDREIQKAEALIDKLKQIRAGLAQDLLTRGIDEHGEVRDPVAHPELFKDEALGDMKLRIPISWNIQELERSLTSIDAGKSPDCPDRPAAAGEWGVLKVSAVRPEGFRAKENKAVTNKAYINEAYEVKDGDLLLSRANTYELVGLICYVKNPPPQLMLCDKTLRLNVDKRYAITEFIFHIIQTSLVRSQIEVHATGSSGSMKNISQDTIKNLLIYIPSSIKEQKQICNILNAHDTRIREEEACLNKLQQIKMGLMEDLLTGRVRVRGRSGA